MPQIPHYLQWAARCPISTPKIAPSCGVTSTLLFFFLGPSPSTVPNDIQILAAIFSQFTRETRHTDTVTKTELDRYQEAATLAAGKRHGLMIT